MSHEPTKTAIGKRMEGEKLTTRDVRELARHDKSEAERLVRGLSRVLVRRITGLTQAKLEAVERRHGVPISGPVVDLFVLLPALLGRLDADDVEGAAGASPALERLREAKAEHAELDLGVRRGELVEVARLRDSLNGMASLVRVRGEAMERAGGPAVRREFDSMLDEWQEQVCRWFPLEGDSEAIGQGPDGPRSDAE